MTVEALKAEISALPPDQRRSLAEWLCELGYDDWDQQMAQDFAAGGRGAHLLDKVKADIAAGKFRPADEFCTERKREGC